MRRELSLPQNLAGAHAYAARSVAAGETVNFHVSSDETYQLSVYQLGANPNSPVDDKELERFPEKPACVQPIYPGSYVHVERALSAAENLSGISVECWVRPWGLRLEDFDYWRGVVAQYTYPDACGFGLFIGNKCVQAYLGDGARHRKEWMKPGREITIGEWLHIVLTWNGRQASLFCNGECDNSWNFSGPLIPGPAPLRLAAYGETVGTTSKTQYFLDGDLAFPVIYNRALDEKEVKARYNVTPPAMPACSDLLACWPLTEERGSTISDASPYGRSGTIINHASWMIGGPGYNAEEVERYERHSPHKGHGLRFASDDLYDCGWKTTERYKIPACMVSGLYVGRIRSAGNVVCEVPFIVRRPNSRHKARMLVLCSTNTWLAYSQPFGDASKIRQDPNPYEVPNFSCYKSHRRGQPPFQVGLNMPIRFNGEALVDEHYSTNGYSHLLRAERFLHQWLTTKGYDYDMATDVDLHDEKELLHGYNVLIISGHSEYWSLEAWKAVDTFLRDGGKVIALTGNAIFWRVSFDEARTVMECRKYCYDHSGDGNWGGLVEKMGEVWHSHDFERGGLLREYEPGTDGYPGWKLLGLEASGWGGVADADFIPFTVTKADHQFFTTPILINVADGHPLGLAANGGMPRAVGHEWAARINHLLPAGTQVPFGALRPQEPSGITTLAEAKKSILLDYYVRWKSEDITTVSEIIHWKRPGGGEVFGAGSIAFGWAMSEDVRLQQLLCNVLYHFNVTPRRRGEMFPSLP